MVGFPCFANCIHASGGECLLNVIGSDRLAEKECACEFFKPRNKTGEVQNIK